VRAVSGGLLFGVPLLYTMEVWWTGSHTTPPQMVAIVGLLAVPVLVLNQTAGFRKGPDVRVRDALADTAETVAIGIVVTSVVLVLLQEVTIGTPARLALGKVLYESIPFCLGVSVARHFLHGGRSSADDADGEATRARATDGGWRPTLADLGATTIGAVFIALSIAPTDEVPMIASSLAPEWVLALMAASVLGSYAIVFAAGFSGQDERAAHEGPFQGPLTETVVSYLIALVTAAVLLWAFQRGLQPWQDLLTRVVVLGFPAAIGGAAGRLAV